jgi:serine protease inhibitor
VSNTSFQLINHVITCFHQLANKIYVKNGLSIKPSFNEIATKKFDSETQSINFADNKQSAKIINDWVGEKTNNKISDLMKAESLNADTAMVIVNAVYFKGLWDDPFFLDSKGPFFLNEDTSAEAEYMESSATDILYGKIEELNSIAFELNYRNSDVSMLFIVPNSRTGLSQLERKLDQVDFHGISKSLHYTYLNLKLPKFKFEFETDLKRALELVKYVTLSMLDNASYFYCRWECKKCLQMQQIFLTCWMVQATFLLMKLGTKRSLKSMKKELKRQQLLTLNVKVFNFILNHKKLMHIFYSC